MEQAVANLKEATELYLEEFPLAETEKPIRTVFEVPAHAELRKVSGRFGASCVRRR